MAKTKRRDKVIRSLSIMRRLTQPSLPIYKRVVVDEWIKNRVKITYYEQETIKRVAESVAKANVKVALRAAGGTLYLPDGIRLGRSSASGRDPRSDALLRNDVGDI